jgi:hypothetical protein
MDTPAPSPFQGTRCKAKSKRSGEQCKRLATPGKEVCRMHGGLTPNGIASPHYKHGLYSKAMPKELRSRFVKAMNDPELLSLEQDIALLTVRASELLEALGQSEAPPWGQAVETLNDLAAALQMGDQDKIKETMAEHSKVVRQGTAAARAYESTWRELREVIQDKAKASRAEWSRLGDLQATLTAGQAMLFVTSLLEAVKREVSDRETLGRVQTAFNLLLEAPANGK